MGICALVLLQLRRDNGGSAKVTHGGSDEAEDRVPAKRTSLAGPQILRARGMVAASSKEMLAGNWDMVSSYCNGMSA